MLQKQDPKALELQLTQMSSVRGLAFMGQYFCLDSQNILKLTEWNANLLFSVVCVHAYIPT